MKVIKTLAVALIMMSSASALAECAIVLSLCKPLGIHSSTRFLDSYDHADRHPNRCLQRAREYLNYCRSNQTVGAEFYINGQLTISTYVSQSASSLWTKAPAGVWIQIQSDY